MEQWWNDIDTDKPKYSVSSVRDKSHVYCSGTELWLPRSETGD